MKKSPPIALYLVTSETVPEGLVTDEMTAVFDEDDDSDISLEECACITTLITNCEDDEEFRSNVSEWWREMLDGSEPTLELLATELTLMSPDQIESYAELEEERWSARTPLVIFYRDDSEGRSWARDFVIECALSTN